MDWVSSRNKLVAVFTKYKYVVLIVMLGIVFMMLPEGKGEEYVAEVAPVVAEPESITQELCDILGQIQGVGKVRVMITEQTGAETIYQVDEDRTDTMDTVTVRRETVIVSGSGGETGLIQTITPPTYLGAIVVCQGAESPTVRLAVIHAVAAVTGISSDRISVLKMK